MDEGTDTPPTRRLFAHASRALRWLWVPATATLEASLTDPQRRELATARAFRSLGQRSTPRPEPGPFDAAASRLAALACLRLASLHALRAHDPEGLRGKSLREAWERLPDVVERAAGDHEDALRALMIERGDGGDAAAHEGGLEGDVVLAGDFVRALLRELEEREASRSTRLFARTRRVTLLLAAIAAVFIAAPMARRALRPDYGPTSRWRASSAEPPFAIVGRGFVPHEEGVNVFFKTNVEPGAFIMFDLGAARSIELLGVQNRLDCCEDLPVPLVAEVSRDRRTWTEVGRRLDAFRFWTVSFPEMSARFVRLRAVRPTSLQLGVIQIR